MENRMERFNETIQLFDNRDPRTFDDIYGDKMDLFEDNNDVIDPRMIKLFEATYQTGNLDNKRIEESKETETYEKLFEEIHQNCNEKLEEDIEQLQEEIDHLEEEIPPGGHNFTGDESAPSGDGVPASHNKPGLSGSDPATVQSGQDYSHNTKFFESVYNTVNLDNKILDE
jgi:hypothetical protein